MPYSYNPGGGDFIGMDFDSFATDHRQHAYAGGSQLKPGERFNAKVPPSYGGGSWFAYEEDVQDWETLTELDVKKRGPALKNATYGMANLPKKTLEREKLVQEDGVEYLLNKLRPYFLKGKTNVFLFRMKVFMLQRRGRMDFSEWIIKWSLVKDKLVASWMDLAEEILNEQDRRYADLLERVRTSMRAQEFQALDDVEKLQRVNDLQKADQMAAFPFQPNLSTLMFLLASDLDDRQRLALTQTMSQRGLKVQDYTFDLLCEVYMEIFQNPKSHLDDPALRGRDGGSTHRTFFVLQPLGTCYRGTPGKWCQDADTGEEGFLPCLLYTSDAADE